MWRTHLGGGSIYSSPAICTEPHLVVAATLTGILAAANPVSENKLKHVPILVLLCDMHVYHYSDISVLTNAGFYETNQLCVCLL